MHGDYATRLNLATKPHRTAWATRQLIDHSPQTSRCFGDRGVFVRRAIERDTIPFSLTPLVFEHQNNQAFGQVAFLAVLDLGGVWINI